MFLTFCLGRWWDFLMKRKLSTERNCLFKNINNKKQIINQNEDLKRQLQEWCSSVYRHIFTKCTRRTLSVIRAVTPNSRLGLNSGINGVCFTRLGIDLGWELSESYLSRNGLWMDSNSNCRSQFQPSLQKWNLHKCYWWTTLLLVHTPKYLESARQTINL